MTAPEPRPYVQPSGVGPTRRWVARCDAEACPLFVEYGAEIDAQARVDKNERTGE